jgi:hypothetical protein
MVPANGTQGVSVPSGHSASSFQYSHEPEAMYQEDSFTLHDRGAEFTITKVVNGNCATRKAN